jgi:PAS domain S-box-containing protein
MKILDSLFSSGDFMPHGYCYLWKPGLVWLHVVSDALIALAYFSIPIALIYFIRKRRDLPFNWMFLCFGTFIMACGTTHAMEVWTLWHGTYWLSGAIKAVTAMASVPTAILLVHLVPRALALPSPEAMKLEIAGRKRAQQALHEAKEELELRVRERTAELSKANEELVAENAQRKRAEKESVAWKDELAAELMAMSRLHEFSTRLLSKAGLLPLLEEVLNAIIALQNADFGNVQLYDPETKTLEIVAHRGFQRSFLDYFSSVNEPGAACGRAMQRRERVIIEDVLADPDFEPHRQIAASAGFRAVQSTPLFSRSGEPLGMISTHFRQPHRPSGHDLRFTDLYARLAGELIERQRAEEALGASEERFRRYFELGLIGMAMTSPTKGILEVNDELCVMLGYERSELLKKTWAEMTYQDDLAADVTQFDRVTAGEIDGYTLDKRWIRKDGRVIDTIMSAKCLRRADGSVDYFVGLVQDITERKRSEEALRAAQAQLAHMARVTTMGELTSSIAHEVNQPLAAVVTNGDACLRWLGNDPPNLDKARLSVAGIIKEGNRAGEIIQRVRALAKKTPPQKTMLGVNEAIEEVIGLVGAELAKHQVLLLKELMSDLPTVFGDRVQLQQVILNLIANGIEAMEPVTDRPRELSIGSRATEDGRVLISVSDCGTGIGPESVDHLFEAFFTTKQEGMGLGLSISRTIVEGHGGRLSAIANKPYGATFQFTLPVAMAVGVSA